MFIMKYNVTLSSCFFLDADKNSHLNLANMSTPLSNYCDGFGIYRRRPKAKISSRKHRSK
ncbi:unnamed protein product, partial [Larinioides sclopetarius]